MPALEHVGDPGVVSAPCPRGGGAPPAESPGLPLLPIMGRPPGHQLLDPVAHAPSTVADVSFPEAKDGPSVLGQIWREVLPAFWGACGSGASSDARAVGTPNAHPRVLRGTWGDQTWLLWGGGAGPLTTCLPQVIPLCPLVWAFCPVSSDPIPVPSLSPGIPFSPCPLAPSAHSRELPP